MRRRYSLGRSVLVWIISALIGWIVAFGGIYYMIRTGDNLFADFLGRETPSTPPATAEQDATRPESPISEQDLRELQKIAPAAGPSSGAQPAGEAAE